jgi:hypothetical protein
VRNQSVQPIPNLGLSCTARLEVADGAGGIGLLQTSSLPTDYSPAGFRELRPVLGVVAVAAGGSRWRLWP